MRLSEAQRDAGNSRVIGPGAAGIEVAADVTSPMKRFAVLLIVVTLTGSPLAHAACILWCPSEAAAGTTVCPHSVARATSPAITEEPKPCTAFLATDAFFMLERRATVYPPAAAVLPPEQHMLVNASSEQPTFTLTADTPHRADPVRILRL